MPTLTFSENSETREIPPPIGFTLKCPNSLECNSTEHTSDYFQEPFYGAENYLVVPVVCKKCSYGHSIYLRI